MHPKVDRLTLNADGSVEVSGPIDWDDDDLSAWFGAVVAQAGDDGDIIFACKLDRDTPWWPPTPTWQLTAPLTPDADRPSGQRLRPGWAGAFGFAWVTRKDGSKYTHPWPNNKVRIDGSSIETSPRDT